MVQEVARGREDHATRHAVRSAPYAFAWELFRARALRKTGRGFAECASALLDAGPGAVPESDSGVRGCVVRAPSARSLEGCRRSRPSVGDAGRRAAELCERPLSWQRVIHGECSEFRREVVRQLLDVKGEKQAIRFALCGCGDHAMTDGERTWIAPRGCGHKLCPRCGRKAGRRLVRRLAKWLAVAPHGDIFTLCLTQRTDPEESLVDARKRMNPKVRRMMDRLKRAGVLAGMRAVHIVASSSGRGWHYHVHLLLEFPAGVIDADKLRAMYVDAALPEFVQCGEDAARLVVPAGAAIPEAAEDDGQMDFWRESRSDVMRAIQYPVRDLAQGLTASRLGKDGARLAECVGELLRNSAGWKLRQTFGRWRKPPPEGEPVVADVEVEDREPRSTSTAARRVLLSGGSATGLGSVTRLYSQARKGSVEAAEIFRDLEATVSNSSEFARRFVAFCRRAWDGPPLPVVHNIQSRSREDGS